MMRRLLLLLALVASPVAAQTGPISRVQVLNQPANQPVTVTNLPTTQPVSGTVAVSNLPANQPVTITGTPTVNANVTFPATQQVTGTVNVGNFPASQAVTLTGTPSVSVSNFPASQAVTGTFFQSVQPVSATALPLPTGAATSALQSQISGQLPATLGAKTGALSLPVVPNTDTPFPVTGTVTVQDANSGPLDTAETPSNVATVGLAPVVAANATALLVKNAPGNLYTAELTAGGAAGYLVVANLASVPASGATIPFLRCIAAPANLTASSGSGIPFRASTGIVILFSTSCTTYTPVGTPAVSILGRAM